MLEKKCIKIVVEFSKVNDVDLCKLINFEMLPSRNLPIEYIKLDTNGQSYCIAERDYIKIRFINNDGFHIIRKFNIGDVITFDDWELYLGLIERSGKRLTQINNRIRDEKSKIVKTFNI